MKKVLIGAILIIVLCLGINYMTDNNYDQKDIDKIKGDISLLRNDLNSLKNEKQKQQLTYPIDDASRKILSDELKDKLLPDLVLDTVWNRFWYYSSLFESIESWNQFVDATGSLAYGAGAILMVFNADAANTVVGLNLSPFYNLASTQLLSWDKNQRFRSTVSFSSKDEINFYAGLGSRSQGTDADNARVGFKFYNGNIYMESYIGSGGSPTVSTLMMAFAKDTVYRLEIKLISGEKALFYVNEELKGVIVSASLPKGYKDWLVEYAGINTGVTAKTITITGLEYIQDRPNI